MSETENSSPETGGVESGGKERAAHKGVYPTLEACKVVKPPSEKFRIFVVTDASGKERYSWGFTADMALTHAAKADGYSAKVAEPKAGGPITKEKVAAKLAEFTDEELAAMGLTRKKAKK